MTDFEQLDEMVRSYIETMLWSSRYDCSDPHDDSTFRDFDYDIEDFDAMTLYSIVEDCMKFLEGAFAIRVPKFKDGRQADAHMLGHDFWLTRNGHGAGFWDGDYEKETGERLTALSKTFPEQNPVLVDHLIHLE